MHCFEYVVFVFYQVSSLHSVLDVSWLYVTSVGCAALCMSSVLFFGILVPCALFSMRSRRLVLTLVFCAPFSMCFVLLFGTVVPRALF